MKTVSKLPNDLARELERSANANSAANRKSSARCCPSILRSQNGVATTSFYDLGERLDRQVRGTSRFGHQPEIHGRLRPMKPVLLIDAGPLVACLNARECITNGRLIW